MSFLSSLGGRKFLLAILVIIMSFIISFVNFITPEIKQKWLDMSLIVVGFYFGYKAASDISGSKQ